MGYLQITFILSCVFFGAFFVARSRARVVAKRRLDKLAEKHKDDPVLYERYKNTEPLLMWEGAIFFWIGLFCFGCFVLELFKDFG